jgi:catechol 2,3-dioxygenase-like lactoylglutathione lyase family enzyme
MNDNEVVRPAGYLEHANISVRSIDAAVKFLKTALPAFEPRGGAGESPGERWLHFGTDSSYICLNEHQAQNSEEGAERGRYGVNHLGFVVDSVADTKARLLAAGYHEGFRVVDHPHRKRLYFHDEDGFEWEFVEYLTDDPAKRNEYTGQ